jgi:hypothetical protein
VTTLTVVRVRKTMLIVLMAYDDNVCAATSLRKRPFRKAGFVGGPMREPRLKI